MARGQSNLDDLFQVYMEVYLPKWFLILSDWQVKLITSSWIVPFKYIVWEFYEFS